MRRITAPLTVLLLGLIGLFLFVVLPADAAEPAPACELGELVTALQTVKDNVELNYAERLRAELAIRKDLLRSVVTCARRETEVVRAKVAEAPVQGGEQQIQENFLNHFDGALAYYDDLERRIDTLGISGSQELARSFREWRANTYTPTTEQALHFLVWIKNQELFQTSQARFADVERAVARLALMEDEAAATLIQTARMNLRDAVALNGDARVSLEQFPPSQDTLALMKQSLEKLAGAYENFFALSDIVQKIIPQAK